jgi:hypothetical protein
LELEGTQNKTKCDAQKEKKRKEKKKKCDAQLKLENKAYELSTLPS